MTEHEKAFYSDGYQLGLSLNNPVTKRDEIIGALKSIYQTIDGLIESLLGFAESQGRAVQCRKGCYWCCHQPVFALSWELDYLNSFISENFDRNTQDELNLRAEAKHQKLRNLSEKEILNSKFPCPLLENGACMAYEARPMACRIYLSTSLESCLFFFNTPDDNSKYPELLDFPLRAGRMMNEGFKAGLKLKGIETKEYRIEEVLLHGWESDFPKSDNSSK